VRHPESATWQRHPAVLARLEFGALLIDHFFWCMSSSGRRSMPMNCRCFSMTCPELGDDRGHELAAWLPVSASRIEHRLELIDHEGDIATFAETLRK